MAVPKYNGKVVLEVLDDRDGNGRPSKGEKFTVLHKMGEISAAKNQSGLTIRLLCTSRCSRRRRAGRRSSSSWGRCSASGRPAALQLRQVRQKARSEPQPRLGPLFVWAEKGPSSKLIASQSQTLPMR